MDLYLHYTIFGAFLRARLAVAGLAARTAHKELRTSTARLQECKHIMSLNSPWLETGENGSSVLCCKGWEWPKPSSTVLLGRPLVLLMT